MKKITLILLLIPFFSSASYVNGCKLTVEIINYQKVKELGVQNHLGDIPYEIESMTIVGIVTQAEEYERADSGCGFWSGRKINETFYFSSVPAPDIANGDHIYLGALTKGLTSETGDYATKSEIRFIGIVRDAGRAE
ncbi:hypothetical protein [Providencia rettgeri]|uniref:hypothetical protein n=1 Tax=Providencia rettgeri TaxID=587 RepID=UPI0024AB6017